MTETTSPSGRLIVLGAGESGVGAAVLGKARGWEVLVSDAGPIADRYKAELEREQIPYEENGHTPERVLQADLAVKSPGIPLSAPLVVQLQSRGVEVISEIEFAGRYTDAPMLCITGSNGKTTTTMLLHHILTSAGIDAGLAGNVGNSLARQVAREPHQCYVIELSSFQLDNMYRFRADIAILLNITPDHLDRYDHSMANYSRAKMRITRNQRPSDYFIYWADDPQTLLHLPDCDGEAARLRFADHPGDDIAAFADDNTVTYRVNGTEWSMPRTALSLPGRHNLYNSLAAGLAATAFGVNPQAIRDALQSFAPVEHRLEPAATINGVRYINDSKATNVDSTYYALEAMTSPTILILGGKDKGNDYSQIDDLVCRKVKAIVAMGVDNSKILSHFGGKVPVIADTHSLAEAVAACADMAQSGDTVLLSPCCASFDLFSSYQDRGRQFKDAVTRLKTVNE